MSIDFATPGVLLLLPVVVALALMPIYAKNRSRPAAMRFANTDAARSSNRNWRLRIRPYVSSLRWIALALIVVAAARPQSSEAREVIKGEGVDIALALDISGSMAALDFDPDNRLEAAKQVIADFVRQREHDRIGIVVFAGDVFIHSPPTIDHDALTFLLDQIDLAAQLRVEDGTAIGMGLATAANMLKDSEAKSKVAVLLTDGVNNKGDIDPLTAAAAAETLGIRVYTVGMGQPEGVVQTRRGPFGTMRSVRRFNLDEETLKEIAARTDGQYYLATDTEALRGIYDEINSLEKSEVECLCSPSTMSWPSGCWSRGHCSCCWSCWPAGPYSDQLRDNAPMTFANPQYLVLLTALPLVIGVAYWAARRRTLALDRVGNPSLVRRLTASANAGGRLTQTVLMIAALGLAIVALARPQWGASTQVVERQGVQLMVALDVSKSMLAEDLKPNRLTRAKLEVYDIIRQLGGDEIGLVLFAGSAFVQFPLTYDYATARTFLDKARPDMIQRQGTALAKAINLSMTGLADERPGQKVILIITDGEDHEGRRWRPPEKPRSPAWPSTPSGWAQRRVSRYQSRT